MAATVDQKLLRATKFPPEFNQKVDMNKVNLEVIKGWITNRISKILGTEDDVVIELCFNLIEASRYPKIKEIQIQLTGFLEKDTASFCQQLWKLCMSAQNSPQGVPQELLEAKKAELIQEKIEQEKAAEEARLRRDQFDRRDRDMDTIRDRERFEHGDRGDRGDRGGRGGYGRGGDSWRGGRDDRDFGGRGGGRGRGDFGRGRGGRDFDRGPRRSRSPGFYEPPRARDSYVPRGRDGGRHDQRRRSPSPATRSLSRSMSRSRSPPRRRRSPSGSITPPTRRRPARSMSRSPSPVGGARRAPRRRSRSYSTSSRSRSPPTRKRRRSMSSSRSRSPQPKSRRRRSISSSRSRSFSRSPSRSISPKPRSGRPAPRSSQRDLIKSRAAKRDVNLEAGRLSRDNSRSRSQSRSRSPPRRRRRRSPSRSRSPPSRRQGSIPRYAPKGRRDSFVSSPRRGTMTEDTRRRSPFPRRSRSRSISPPRRHNDSRSPSPDNMRDIRDISRSRSRSRSRSQQRRSRTGSHSPVQDVEMGDDAPQAKQEVNATTGLMKDPVREARELKERLLRDKIKKMRGSVSSGQSRQKVDASKQNESPPAPDFTE